jgi:hypothetical protein
VRERGAIIRAAPERAGQVRLRLELAAPEASWRVEPIDGAMRLPDFEPAA